MFTPPPPGSKIIIVGAGAFGLSTAYALSLLKNKNYSICVFDRGTCVPVRDAASTDINKVVRMDYGDAVLYQQLMIDALPMWKQWNAERAAAGESPVFYQTGAIFFGKDGQFSPYEEASMQHITEAGFGHVIERFDDGPAIVRRFPHFKDAVANGYNVAYLNKEGGWCHSSEAIHHLYKKCVGNGVQFVLGPTAGCFAELETKAVAEAGAHQDKTATVIGIRTKDGRCHHGDRVVMCTGAWTAGLVDCGGDLVATGQMVVQFKPPKDSVFVKTMDQQPVWSADVSHTGFYGFPLHPIPSEGGGHLLKVACHGVGFLNPRQGDQVSVPRTNPGDTIPRQALDNFRTFLAGFFPSTQDMDVHYARVCWYSDSCDSNFLVGPHPGYSNLLVASGDSGHGMKFLPNIGLKIAQVIEGIDSDYSRAWCWKQKQGHPVNEQQQAPGGYDGMRAGQEQGKSIPILEDKRDQTTWMVSSDELKTRKKGAARL